MSYKYLKAPGQVMTSNMQDHKSRGTSGEDFVLNGGCTSTSKMTKPCSDLKLIGSRSFSDGTYKEFYQGSMNGYKFSMYTCHCHDFVTTGDDYAGSTGYHLHHLYFHGHQSIDYMQNNRNTKGVTLGEIDAKCVPSTSTPPTKTIKGYSFNECWGYHPDTNVLCWFDIEEYGSTEDDICFNLSNLTKNSDGTYTLKSAEDGYSEGTKFRKVKTTFYTDGTKSTGSSSTTSTKHKYRRTHGEDQGYYKIEDKYMNGLTVKGTTADTYPCEYSKDNNKWSSNNVIGTTTMDVKL